MTTMTEGDFCKCLISFWDKSPTHRIRVPKRARQIRANSPDGNYFIVNSLRECLSEYIWNSANYSQNKQELARLSSSLKSAMNAGNVAATERSFREIYRWGGVKFNSRGKPNISSSMLHEWSKSHELIEKILVSVEILRSGQGLGRFNGRDLFMNSGYTKVVSLASSEEDPLIIFDGRVGAALGDLVAVALVEGGFSDVETSLLFPWGSSRTPGINRNPSNHTLKFPDLFRGSVLHKSQRHAVAMHNAYRVVSKAAKRLSVSPRDFEAALFMWGYSV